MTIGIMSAMREEAECLLAEMHDLEEVRAGMRTYYKGTLWGTPVVLVFSRWGKVAAATTATFLIERFGVEQMVFTGVAGAVDESLRIGDVVVASRLYQHDMDARPLRARHEIPLLGMTALPTDAGLRQASLDATVHFLSDELPSRVATPVLRRFRVSRPRVVEGEIASGDRFFASRADREQLKRRLPAVACVEMEGGAVAQVCYEYDVPLSVIRTISDTADEGAPADFHHFIQEVASVYAHGILKNLLTSRCLVAS